MKRTIALILTLGLWLVVSPSFAVGYYKFCAQWQYNYHDSNFGEDYLLNYQGQGTYNVIAAAYTWANVFFEGTEIYAGYLDSAGCTTSLPANKGNYIFRTTGAVARDNRFYFVQRNATSGWTWNQWEGPLLARSSGTETITKYWGSGTPVANAAAVMVRMATTSNYSHSEGLLTIYAEDECPGGAGACMSGDVMHLGTDANGAFLARRKYVILHEYGHYQQDHYMGSILGRYDQSEATQAQCKCDHVEPAGHRAHCLQSREYVSAAQQEGYAHFFAARAVNDLRGDDMVFVYAKQFRLDDGTVLQPPVVVTAANTALYFAWMKNRCAQADSGTELDWLAFYYHMNSWTTSTFTTDNMRSLYRRVCAVNGVDQDCNNKDVRWNDTVNAVGSVWGTASTKYAEWTAYGPNHGVNY